MDARRRLGGLLDDDAEQQDPPAGGAISITPRRLALAGAAAAAIAAVWALGALLGGGGEPGGESLEPEALPQAAAAAPDAGAEAAAEPEEIVVAVVGEVAHPGLVTLPPGSRVSDALAAAEPLGHAELGGLNIAQRLVDGEQIAVPAVGAEPPPPPAGAAAPGAAGPINLNTAAEAELTTLKGVGEATAAAIVKHREEIGGFSSVEQLLDVPGIGPAKFAALADEVRV